MNKKNILYTAYSALFIGICLAPAVLMPVTDKNASKENRAQAEAPKIKTEEGSLNFEFFSQFETYFSEHFGLRTQLVTLDGKLRASLFGSSSNEDVIVGKDDWLYYAPTTDDFANTNTLSDRAINNINHNLTLLSDYCRDKGAWFTFTVAPNKNTIYPEYMPYNYIETDGSDNLEKLTAVYEKDYDEYFRYAVSSLAEESLKAQELFTYDYCDLKKFLLEQKEKVSVPLYHKTDTHWNNVGALAGRNALLSGKWSSGWSTSTDWSGDLAEMLYPSDVPLDTQYYTDYDFTYEYVGRFRGLDDINIKTTCKNADGKLLMYRDSFGEAILPFMAESFAEAEFTRSVPYNTASVTEGTSVILEIVERNLGDLQKYAPVMPAPVYEGELPEGDICYEASMEIEQSGEYYHFYGVLGDDFFLDDNTRIFIKIDDTAYEAFNCFEDKLLECEGETSDNGFSLYIPMANGEIPDKSRVAIITLSSDGRTVKDAYSN